MPRVWCVNWNCGIDDNDFVFGSFLRHRLAARRVMKQPLNIVRLLIEIIAAVALAEVGVMFVLPVLAPDATGAFEAMLDAGMLSLVAGPMILWRVTASVGRAITDPLVDETRQSRGVVAATSVAVLAGVVIAVLAVLQTRHSIHADALHRFESMADLIKFEAQSRANRVIYGLKGARGTYAASKSVERMEFRGYVTSRDLPAEFPGTQGMGFIKKVPRAELESFIQKQRLDDAPDFDVYTQGHNSVLYVVTFIDPLEENLTYWGMDLSNDARVSSAITKAIDSGQSTVTDNRLVVSRGRDDPGYLYFVPVYRNGTKPTTPEQRRANLDGVLFAPIRYRGVFAGLTDPFDGMVEMRLSEAGDGRVDAGQRGDALRVTPRPVTAVQSSSDTPLFMTERSIRVADQTWSIQVQSTAAFKTTVNQGLPLLVGIGGGILSTLGGLVIWSLATSRARAQRLAHTMTRDLVAAKQAAETAMRDNAALRSGLDNHAILSITDATGHIIDVNDGFCQISGYNPSELIGRDHRMFSSGHHPKGFFTQMWKTIKSGRSWRAEVCNRAKDGGLYWVDTTIVPFVNAQGRIEKFVSIRFDITHKKRAEEENARMGAIIASTNSAVVSVTTTGRITTWNRGAEELFGYTADEAVGMTIGKLMPHERRHEEAMILEAISKDKVVENLETQRLHKDGRPVDLSVTASPIHDKTGQVVGAAMIATDITQQKKARAELLAAREQAEAANRSKSEFLANMSHEIRTPMTAILGYTELLKREGDMSKAPPTRLEYLDTIQRNGEHLLSIINDILDLSRIEAGQMEIDCQETCPRQVIDQTLAALRVRAGEKSLAFGVEYVGRVPQIIQTDPVRFRQILTNIVSNAIKFTDNGGVRLVITHDEIQQRLRIEVHDTGIGMTREQIDKLFSAFVQADGTMTRRHGGNGLGLNISKRLAKMLGGDITVKSTHGVGSVFTILIPTTQPAERNTTKGEARAA
ncbi:MAG: PAS domain S-box protein [Phycisphaera sp.]|nr:PAS domain S-box protein [Phycisphaera sp.]